MIIHLQEAGPTLRQICFTIFSIERPGTGVQRLSTGYKSSVHVHKGPERI